MWSERDRGRERERRDGERVCERERGGSCWTSSTHTANGRHSWYLLRAPCPGFRSLCCTGTSYLHSTQVPWPVQECALLCVCMLHDYTHFLLKGHVGSDYSQTQSMCVCVENLCCSVTISPSLHPSLLSIPFLPISIFHSLSLVL